MAQFVDDQDRLRPIDENILVSALYKTNIVKIPFTRVRSVNVRGDYVEEGGPSITIQN